MKKYNLSSIMRTAHSVKTGYENFGDALRAAWAAAKLQAQLRNQPTVNFTFIKADGSERQAIGTLMSGRIPTPKGTGYEKPLNIVTYFDLEKESYRSFRVERLKVA